MSVSFTLNPTPSFFSKNLRLVQVSPDVSSSVPIISSSDFTIIAIFPFAFYNNVLFSTIGTITRPTGNDFSDRSEERRVGKECRSWWWAGDTKERIDENEGRSGEEM